MQYQCPQCYGYDIVVVKPKPVWIWMVPMVVIDVAIVLAIITGLVDNPTWLFIALIVIDMLLTWPLRRAIRARSQHPGSNVYQCTACGHQWTETESADAPETHGMPARASGFRMTVADVFAIKGRGTVVTGRVESGGIAVGDAVELHGANGIKQTVVDGIEKFRKTLARAETGDNIGMLLSGIGKDDVQHGDVLQRGW